MAIERAFSNGAPVASTTRRNARAAIGLVLALGLVTTALISLLLARSAETYDRGHFSRVSTRFEQEIRRQLNEAVAPLHHLAALWSASERISADEFESMATSLRGGVTHGSHIVLGFIRRTATPSPEATVEFVSPREFGRQLRSLDVNEIEPLRHALDRARASGSHVTTDPIKIPVPHADPAVLVSVQAVWNHLPDQARRTIEPDGWVFSVFAVADCMAAVHAVLSHELDFEVWLDNGSRPLLLFDRDGHMIEGGPDARPKDIARRQLSAITRFDAAGRTWQVSFSASAQFTPFSRAAVWAAALGGTTLSFGLAGVVWALLSAGARAERLAARMTANASARVEELERLALVVRKTRNVVIISDERGRIVWVNDAFTRLTGYLPDEVIGFTPGQRLQFAKTDRHTIARIREALAQGRSCREEILNRGKHGNEYWLDIEIHPLTTPDGGISGFISVQVDITDRKLAELEVAEARRVAEEERERLQMALAGGNLGSWDWSVDSGTMHVDERTRQMIGESAEWPLSSLEAWNARTHPDDLNTVRDAAEHHFRGESQDYSILRRVRHRDGSWRTLLEGGRVVTRDANGKPTRVVGVHLDLTKQRQREAELERLRDEADAANRAKDEFLANMSHEIRTPMTAVLGYAELIAGDSELPAQCREPIESIRRNGKHLLTILNDVLDSSKIEAGKMAVEAIPTDPAAVVSDVIEMYSALARDKNVSLVSAFLTPVPRSFACDPTRLKQILLNLVGNAIKFTDSGSVTIAVSLERGDTPSLRFEVADSGIGMSAEHLARLFKPFTQADGSTSRRFGGTGLGLHISRHLAHLLGGEITVSSRLGVGTTFRASVAVRDLDKIELWSPGLAPAASTTLTAQPVGAPTAKPLAGFKILVAEDGIDNQRLILFHLRRAGAELTLVDNGASALEKILKAESLGFNLGLLDIQMPELDGYEVTWRARASGSTLPLVALTAHAMPEDRARCIASGFDDYTTKPIDASKLVQTCLQWGTKSKPLAA
ncbi:MAG: ATP-binding protein [Phycisphaerales bacterium]